MIKRIFEMLYRFFSDRKIRFGYFARIGLYNRLSDELFLKKKYRVVMGAELNLNSPQTFNEKLQWLKLHDRRPEYTMMVDKYRVREYITEKLGEEYLIPLIGVWDDPDEIDFEALPDQFVLKCNHNSGTGMCICRDKSKLDVEKVRKELKKGLKENYYLINREWPYKNVPRKIVCEQYMTNSIDEKELSDYKLMCFNSRVKCMFTCTGRFSAEGVRMTFFDTEWNRMPFTRHYPAEKRKIEKPKSYEKMIELAEKLAEGIPFVRIDFYEIQGRPYFGEMTFFPGAGLEEFEPEEWDRTLGNWIKFPGGGGQTLTIPGPISSESPVFRRQQHDKTYS